MLVGNSGMDGHGLYDVAKDFAAPVATIIAALVATFITILIQLKQVRLANDELRFKLFDRRLEVHDALTSDIFGRGGNTDALKERVRVVLQRIKGYQFLFPFELSEKIAKAELLLFIISATCDHPPDDLHRTVLNYFHDYHAKVEVIRKEMNPHLRIEN